MKNNIEWIIFFKMLNDVNLFTGTSRDEVFLRFLRHRLCLIYAQAYVHKLVVPGEFKLEI